MDFFGKPPTIHDLVMFGEVEVFDPYLQRWLKIYSYTIIQIKENLKNYKIKYQKTVRTNFSKAISAP